MDLVKAEHLKEYVDEERTRREAYEAVPPEDREGRQAAQGGDETKGVINDAMILTLRINGRGLIDRAKNQGEKNSKNRFKVENRNAHM